MSAKTLYTGGSSSVLFTDRRDFYPNPQKVMELYKNANPLLKWLSAQSKLTNLTDPLFKQFETRQYWVRQYLKVTTGATSAADNAEDTLAVTVTGSKGLGTALTNALVGHQVEVFSPNAAGTAPGSTSKGVLVITTFTSVTSIGVKNLTGNSITIADNDWLEVIGNVHGEGTTAPNAWADELQVVWGQCGIFKTSLELTETLKTAALRGDRNELARLRALKMAEHLVQKERAMLFSANQVGTNLGGSDTFSDGGRTDADGNVIRPTYGIIRALVDYGSSTGDDKNVFEWSQADYDYDSFVDDAEQIFTYDFQDGSMKTMFASAKVISFFHKIAASGFIGNSAMRVEISDMKTDELGLNYNTVKTPHGYIKMIHLPTLTKSPYNGYAFIPSAAHIVHAIYRPMTYKQNIKTDDAYDGQKDQIMSDEGMGFGLLESHKLIKLV